MCVLCIEPIALRYRQVFSPGKYGLNRASYFLQAQEPVRKFLNIEAEACAYCIMLAQYLLILKDHRITTLLCQSAPPLYL